MIEKSNNFTYSTINFRINLKFKITLKNKKNIKKLHIENKNSKQIIQYFRWKIIIFKKTHLVQI